MFLRRILGLLAICDWIICEPSCRIPPEWAGGAAAQVSCRLQTRPRLDGRALLHWKRDALAVRRLHAAVEPLHR